jgi:glycosyltransferase involved in cell wall biosynthesis
MKKDLFIITYSALKTYGGGIESWLIKFLSFSEYLFVKYDNIYVIGYLTDNNQLISDSIKVRNIHFFLLNIKSKLNIIQLIKFFLKTRRLIIDIIKRNKRNADLLSIGTIYPTIPVFLISKKRYQIRRIVWLRSLYFKQINLLKSKSIKSILTYMEYGYLKKTDIIIANGYDTQDAYQKKYNIRDVFVIPNAIDESVVKENHISFQNEKIKIGYIGRFCQSKGIDFFIDSIEKYNRENEGNNKEFVFIGWGKEEYENIIIALTEKYDNIIYLGKLENAYIFEELSKLDATVNLSTSGIIGGGGISNSLLESLFANNLLICYDNPIYRQVVNEENACLIQESDIFAFANLCRELDDRQRMINKLERAKHLKQYYLFSKHIENFISIMK